VQDVTMTLRDRTVRILGTHGVPAGYGGFETAAENIARFLVDRGWRVVVYCQAEGRGPIVEDVWQGIERVTIPVDLPGWRGTSRFDWLSIDHACRFRDVCLTFGYNTGIYNYKQRVRGIPNVINMDGIEWARKRWGLAKQSILYVNERFAALYGDMLIADHPVIHDYLLTRAPGRKIRTLTYGAHPVASPPPTDALADFGVEPGGYFTLIARPIPENTILEIVRGFSRARRGVKLVVLGTYDRADPYHASVLDAASDEVLFPGAVFDQRLVVPLRYHGIGYLHGHTVGGTNPSLVEAMATGCPVIAHDNPYNRWVVGDGAIYFDGEDGFADAVARFLASDDLRAWMREAVLARFKTEFTWDRVAGQYETLLNEMRGR
jgi:glycosyltransferase involved in cell wall biosynthesis